MIWLFPAKAVEGEPSIAAQAPVYSYRIVKSYPHDPLAFTQGLVYQNGFLYEGTGLHGRSSLRKVALETGKVLMMKPLPRRFFGEGVTAWGERVFQLTWRSKVGFVYEAQEFKPLRTFTYDSQGWGLTHDGRMLILSDGSSQLYFLHPETFVVQRVIDVHDGHQPVPWLNELEYVDGMVYANVWKTSRIAMIDPATGQVGGWIELEGLRMKVGPGSPADVLNGIAYDAQGDRLFVTGKLWPYLFEIKLTPEPKR